MGDIYTIINKVIKMMVTVDFIKAVIYDLVDNIFFCVVCSLNLFLDQYMDSSLVKFCFIPIN